MIMKILPVVAVFMLAPSLAMGLDSESMNCLSCHDAAVANDITLQVCPIAGCDHPIGINYVTLAGGNASLTPPSSLDPAIRLVDGSMVGCGSCHVPYDSSNHQTLTTLRQQYPAIPDPMLNMDNRQSQLCLGCHKKK